MVQSFKSTTTTALLFMCDPATVRRTMSAVAECTRVSMSTIALKLTGHCCLIPCFYQVWCLGKCFILKLIKFQHFGSLRIWFWFASDSVGPLHIRFRFASDLVSVRFGFGSGPFRIRCRFASDLVAVRFRIGSVRLRIGFGSLRIRFALHLVFLFASDLVSVRFGFGSLRIWFGSVSDSVSVRFGFGCGSLQNRFGSLKDRFRLASDSVPERIMCAKPRILFAAACQMFDGTSKRVRLYDTKKNATLAAAIEHGVSGAGALALVARTLVDGPGKSNHKRGQSRIQTTELLSGKLYFQWLEEGSPHMFSMEVPVPPARIGGTSAEQIWSGFPNSFRFGGCTFLRLSFS